MSEPVDVPALPFGRAYYRWCRAANARFGPKPETVRGSLRKRQGRFDAEKARFLDAQRAFAEVEFRYLEGDRELEKAVRRLEKARKRFKSAERRFGRPSFAKAMQFLGWPLAYHEALFFASVMTMFVFTPVLLLFIVWAVLAVPDPTTVLTFAPVVILVLPMGLFLFLVTFPESLAKAVRVYSLGKSPESVSYLAMSMRLTPSLDKAVNFASENSEEPMSSALEQVSWDVYLRKHPTVEEAFVAMAHDWGQFNDDLRRSFHAIRAAALEQTPEGLDRTLEKANDIILTGTKQRIEHFVAGLNAPTTVLFAMGVLLPMTIGAALPLLSTNLSIPSFSGGGGTQSLPQPINPAPLVLLMDIIFPFVAFVYAYRILGTRPGTSSPPDVPRTMSKRRIRTVQVSAFALSAFLIGLGVYLLTALPAVPPESPSSLEVLHRAIAPLPILWGIAFGLGYYLLAMSRQQKKRRDEILRLERDFPDGLFQLGSRIAEGYPVERAIEMTGKAMKDTKVEEIFDRIAQRAKLSRTTIDEVLFGADGLVKEYPSRMIRAALRVVVEVSKKDARTAGKTIIQVSNYLKDMKKIDNDTRINLKASSDNMKATGVIFAPLVMGVMVALYGFLFTTFADLGDLIPTAMMPVPTFQMIIGVFLLLMVVVIMYYVAGIEWGEDWIERRYLIGAAMPVAVLLFTVTAVGAQMFFGG